MTSVPFELIENSVLIHAHVNGLPVAFILDTGDAIGPVFNNADTERLGLNAISSFQVSGAGGTSTSYETIATVTFDDRTFRDEQCAIDPELQGNSLLGLPFFLAKCRQFGFDLETMQLTMLGL